MSKRKRDINSPNNEQPLRGLRILFLVRTPQERIRVTRVLSRRLEELGASLVGSVENLQSWTRSEVASVVVCTDDISHAKTCCNPLPLSAFEGVVDVSWAAGCVQNRQVATIRLLNVSEATQTSIDDCDGGSRGVIDDALDGDDQQETMEAAKWWPPRNLRPRRYLQPSSDMDCEEEASTRQDRIEAAKNIPKYACQRKSHLEACPNERLCEYLNAMADLRAMESHDSRLGDTKYRAYRLASAAIRCFPFRIRSAEEAEYIPYCGGRVKEAIHEYLQTGKLSEVSKLWTEEYFINLWSLLGVHGIGTKTGRELLASGVTSLDLVVQHCLSGKHPSLKLPLVFYNDLNHNLMSRDDAVRIHDYVINVASSLGLSLEFALAGGFRRNKKNGHDVDLLMRHKYLEFGHSSELQVLVRALRASGFIVATFHETIGSLSFPFPLRV
uniref:BRCT domain-containing protein n=1 Tax=Compsopogon caeruleus TaxID=31354 RepID=A0A6T6BMC9_9RHOD|mmetsp:Transcript_16847/g.34851  ORF Transcript_16847/g.34851 Transcript_16847/m.34851 type:complete len:441 (+) Transcript_16847:1050-2372(+)